MALNPIGFVRGKTMADAKASGVDMNDVFLTSQSVTVGGSALQINRIYLGKELIAAGHRMTTGLEGLGKLYTDTLQSVAPTEVFDFVNRTYGLQIDSNGRLVVNVPWEDSYGYADTTVAGTFLTTTHIEHGCPHYYMNLSNRTFTEVTAANLPTTPADGVFYKITTGGIIDKSRLTKIVGPMYDREFPYVATTTGKISLKTGDVLYKQPGGTGYEIIPITRNTLIPVVPTQLAVDKAIDLIQSHLSSVMVFIGVITPDELPLKRTYTVSSGSSKTVRQGDTWKIGDNGSISNDRLMNPASGSTGSTSVRQGDILIATQVPTNSTDNVKYTLIPAGDTIADTWRKWTVKYTNADNTEGTKTYEVAISTDALKFTGNLGLSAGVVNNTIDGDTVYQITFDHTYQLGSTAISNEKNYLTTGELVRWHSDVHYYPTTVGKLTIGKMLGVYDDESNASDNNYIIVDKFGHIKSCGGTDALRTIDIPAACYATATAHKDEALLGLVKLGFIEDQAANPKTYKIQINEGNLYVSVPWTSDGSHYTSKKVVSSSATETTNGTATTYATGGLHTGKVYLNHIDNGQVISTEQLATDGSFQISSKALDNADTQGAITFGMYWKE